MSPPAKKKRTSSLVEFPATKRSTGSPRKRTDEVIEAAASVFAERGYHGATTQDIADRLRIRQATLYYYFPSKDAALELVCQRGVEGFIENAQAVAMSADSPEKKLAGIVRCHLDALEEKHAFVKTFLKERQHLSDDARKKVGRLSRRYELIVQQVFEAGVASGRMRADLNCRLASLALLGICNATADWYGKEPGATVSLIARSFSDLVLNGVLAAGKATA
jgi:AcrR family transcriptional regulator